MTKTRKAAQRYEAMQRTGCSSLMSAMSESEFVASIGLTGSNLTGNFMSREAMDRIKQRATDFQRSFQGDPNTLVETSELLKHPPLREQAALLEALTHEMVHGLQKHAYRSVYTLVEALQTVELAELKLGFLHASSGGTWSFGQSYMQCLEALDQNLAELLSEPIYTACGVVQEAYGERRNGLGLLHLVEGQAHVAARSAMKAFDALGVGNLPGIYTDAWRQFVNAGGSNPLLFVALTGAALRYGDINDDTGGSFRESLPNPVDIFIYLLAYVNDLESWLAHMDQQTSSAVTRALSSNATVHYHASALVQNHRKAMKKSIQARRHLANDTDDEDFSFLKSNESADDFDDEDEMDRMLARRHAKVWGATEVMIDSPQYDELQSAAASVMLAIEMLIATIIEETYTRFAEPMDEAFARPPRGKIAAAVGRDFRKLVPDYCNVGIFHRLILDQEFTLGKMVWFYLNQMREEVRVQPFDQMEPMLYFEYQGLRQIPEAIKRVLAIADWRAGKGEAPPSGPYCCELHGSLPLGGDVFDQLQSCTESDSTGQIAHHLLHRSVGSLFRGA